MECDPLHVVLAIDPGSEKCGIAVVAELGGIEFRSIVATRDLSATVRDLIEQYRPRRLLCGRGTGSKPIVRALQAAALDIPLTLVDEAYTSEAARARYVAEIRRAVWQNFFPAAFAPRPYRTTTTSPSSSPSVSGSKRALICANLGSLDSLRSAITICTAIRIASIMLCSLAMPLPAISKAVP